MAQSDLGQRFYIKLNIVFFKTKAKVKEFWNTQGKYPVKIHAF